MKSLLSTLKRILTSARTRTTSSWTWFRARPRWQQASIGALALALVVGAVVFARGGAATTDTAQVRTVTLASVGSLSGTSSGASIVGTIRSVSQADLLAQTGGTVRSVHTTLGARVPAGFVIADLANAGEAAAVLQAEGAYDAAIAGRNITTVQSGNSQISFTEAQTSARTTYRSVFTALETTLNGQIDSNFANINGKGSQVLINQGPYIDLQRTRENIRTSMDAWRANLSRADGTDPATLLAQATKDTQDISTFLAGISNIISAPNIIADSGQLAALASARATTDAQLAALSGARDVLNAKKTAAQIGSSSNTGGTQLASADASIKQALGVLRGAQANYEKTRIRATIGGTVNFLSIKKGEYVGAFQKVATIAQNGALEIVAYIPEEQRTAISVGMKVSVEGNHPGTITAIAPALDALTKQIEVRIAVDAFPDLVNGQSVRITLPSEAVATPTVTASSTAPLSRFLLPLSAVKLLPESRAVFSVDSDGRIVAHTVTIGEVIGDRIEILSGITPDMRIVTDVRGLSEGQKVQIGEAVTI